MRIRVENDQKKKTEIRNLKQQVFRFFFKFINIPLVSDLFSIIPIHNVKHALDSIPLLDNNNTFNILLLKIAAPKISPPDFPIEFDDKSKYVSVLFFEREDARSDALWRRIMFQPNFNISMEK